MERYSFNPATYTLTITAAFSKKLQDPKSAEYELLKTLRSDFPTLSVESKTHRTPTKYHTKNNEEFSCNQFKHLTYENMERFISAVPGSEKYLPVYQFIKNEASGLNTSPYAVVRRWFVAQFPEYRNNPVFYLHNEVAPITDITPFLPKGETAGNAS